MNSQHAITAENLMLTLPDVLRNDKSISALAVSVASVLARRVEEINSLLIYSRINELPGELLDILANDFKIDWWDTEYTLDEKRKTLKDSWRVHRILGTKAAVEIAISAVYSSARVVEWFEYSGKPYHFKLLIDSGDTLSDYEKQARVIERVNYYKNLRSVFESLEFRICKSVEMFVGTAIYAGNILSANVGGVSISDTWYTDESNDALINENSVVLLE